jgi:hypothetical protein
MQAESLTLCGKEYDEAIHSRWQDESVEEDGLPANIWSSTINQRVASLFHLIRLPVSLVIDRNVVIGFCLQWDQDLIIPCPQNT